MEVQRHKGNVGRQGIGDLPEPLQLLGLRAGVIDLESPRLLDAGNAAGAGTGQHSSLTQYLAGRIEHIEGGFLSHVNMAGLSYTYGEETIHSSMDKTGSYDVSMFRYKD